MGRTSLAGWYISSDTGEEHMSDSLEQRVSEQERRITGLENLMVNLPQTMNLRLETIAGAQHEVAARLGLMDKQITGLLREFRDLRGNITRQLAEHDSLLDTMELHIEGFSARLEGMDQRLGALDRLQEDISGMNLAIQQLLDRA